MQWQNSSMKNKACEDNMTTIAVIHFNSIHFFVIVTWRLKAGIAEPLGKQVPAETNKRATNDVFFRYNIGNGDFIGSDRGYEDPGAALI
jgi:hypothetical protein